MFEVVQEERARHILSTHGCALIDKKIAMYCPALLPAAQVDKKILGGFVLEFEDRLVDKSDSKKDEEYRNLVDKLERDLLA